MKIGKIADVETKVLEMPYTKPLVTATNNFTVARGLLVTVVTGEGIEGYGYSDLFPRTGETPETARQVIETVLKAKVVGKELEDLTRIRADIDHTLTGNPRAKAALETAMYDALARSYHIPFFLLFGGRYRSEVKVIKMVSVGEPDAMAEEAKQLVRDGLALKLKVSGKIEKDLPRVAAVRKAVGDGVFIKIEADQSCRTFADAQTLIKHRMIDSINTGIPKVGSIDEVRRIAELCEANGIRCALSNTAGSMVGDAAAVHLAASTPGISPLCELGEFEVITGDPFFGLTVDKGTIGVPEGEGLGVSLRGF
jgi:L-alanine-DL-glutamate epimerase-like enolase superfamily enzyme